MPGTPIQGKTVSQQGTTTIKPKGMSAGAPAGAPAGVPAEAFHALTHQYQLALETGLSKTRQELVFRILNRTIIVCQYNRATLWSFDEGRPALQGLSGKSDVDPLAPLTQEWTSLVRNLKEPGRLRVLTEEDFPPEEHDHWEHLQSAEHGLSILWVPIRVENELVAAIWMERWGGKNWEESDCKLMESLALSYSIGWSKFAVRLPWRQLLHKHVTGNRVLLAFCLILLALIVIPVRLRIVAPCEIIPKEPFIVAAPLDGVVERMLVQPGMAIEKGQLLLRYDKRLMQEELEVSRQQVNVIRSDLERARIEAFENMDSRGRIVILEHRLAQEEARLRLAEKHAAMADIKAEVDGIARLDAPDSWRGRPVTIGERLLMVVDPRKTKVRIWLPMDDNIDFDQEQAIQVMLNTDPGNSLVTHLSYVSNHASQSDEGMPSFQAEAEWVGNLPAVKLGLKGNAILYGNRVPLGYWLLRRPLKVLRAFFGI